MNNTTMQSIYQATAGGFGAIASAFVIESLQHMIVWLIVMFAVIAADLVSGLMKCYKMRQRIRPSRACRDTITKAVSYFSFVVAACMIDLASNGEGNLERYCCLFVIIVEGISIGGNILKAHGYDLDGAKLLEIILAKRIEVAREDMEDVITKTDKKNENDDIERHD